MSSTKFKNLFDLNGKIAIVTGGGSGIGRAVSLAYGEYGAKVVVADVDLYKAEGVVGEVADLPGEGMPIEVDVTDSLEVEDMVRKVFETYGRIDILFNNAGRSIKKPAVELTLDDWNKVIGLNLTGMFLCAHAVGRVMVKQSTGKIINTASVSSALGHPNSANYAASKHGVLGMMKVLANEWAKYNINVNAIGPGVTRTPMTEKAFLDEEIYEELVAKVPMGRLGNTDDLVGAAIFLASRASDYITGQIIYIDGGRLVD